MSKYIVDKFEFVAYAMKRQLRLEAFTLEVDDLQKFVGMEGEIAEWKDGGKNRRRATRGYRENQKFLGN